MTKILVMDSAKKLNFFPAKQGISPYYSPRIILHQKNLDYPKNCKTTFDYLEATKEDIANMSANDTQTIKWYVDSFFAVHKDMRSHTRAIMTLGHGAVISDSTKQMVNAKSSTESKMIAVHDTLSKLLCTKKFIQAQGHQVKANIVYQDNLSAMNLKLNGKSSSGKRTPHFNIKFFYFTDLIKRGEMQVKFCPTNEMIADYMTKPLVGSKFIEFKNKIMGKK
jgi:hypothetical protein